MNKEEAYKITLEARRDILSNELAKNTPYREIIEKYSKEWNLAESTIRNYLYDYYAYMNDKNTTQTLINLNIDRLDNLFSDSVKSGDRKNALSAIDKLNKMLGAYKEKLEIKNDDEITVKFGF